MEGTSQQQQQKGQLILFKKGGLHVGSFPRYHVPKNGSLLTRPEFQDRSKQFKQRYNKSFAAKGHRTRISFEEKPDDAAKMEELKEKVPWKIEITKAVKDVKDLKDNKDAKEKPDDPAKMKDSTAKVTLDGKFDESRSKRYIALLSQGNNFKIILFDKWYNFEVPPKQPTLTPEEVEAKFKKDKTKMWFSKAGNSERDGNEGNEDEDVTDLNSAEFQEDYEQIEGGEVDEAREENDWDFEEEFEDDTEEQTTGNDNEDTEKNDKLFGNEEEEEDLQDQDDAQFEEKKNQQKEMSQLVKLLNEKSATDDMMFEINADEDDDDEFEDDDEDEDENEASDSNNPQTGSGSSQGEKRKAGGDDVNVNKKQKTLEGAVAKSPNDPNLLTVEEVKKFLIQPSDIKEITEKFQSRMKTDPRNKQKLTEILKQVAVIDRKSVV